MSYVKNIIIFLFVVLGGHTVFGAPSFMTFQTKILSPSGEALEAGSVNFRFTVLDTNGTCTLYVEDFSNVSMSGSKGIASFSLGNGSKQFPPTATDLYEVFNNAPASALACQGSVVTYSPSIIDNRQMVMQFNDGSGWQTLPKMAINSVPYANYATRAESLGAYSASSYLRTSTLPSCGAAEALRWSGSAFSCIPASGGGGGGGPVITGVTSISNASGDITLAAPTSTGKIIVSSNTPSTSTSTGALVVSGGMGVSGGVYTGGAISSGSTVSAVTSVFSPQLYGTSSPSGNILIDGTSNAAKGNVGLASAGGRVGIGTAAPNFTLDVRGATYIGSLSASSPSALSVDQTLSGGTTTSAFGISVYNLLDGAVSDTLHGISSSIEPPVSGTNSAVNVRGVNSSIRARGGGTMANTYNFYARTFGSTNLPTNAYGLYVESLVGTNRWGVYQAASSDRNYFAGNVGIGTTTPEYQLSVVGDINVTGNFRVNGSIFSGASSTMNGVTNINNASGDVTIAPATGTGAVQINSGTATVSPTTGALIVSGGIGVSGGIYTGGAISSGSSVSAVTSMFTPQLYGTSSPSGNILIDGTSNAAKGNVLLATAGNGNVGVGTTSPTQLLHVSKSVNTSSGVAIENLNSGSIARSDLTLASDGGSAGIQVYSAGYISTHLADRAALVSLATLKGLNITATAVGGDIRFTTNGGAATDERMRIDSSGNVGIGTTSPSSSLHVMKTQNAGTSVLATNSHAGASATSSYVLGNGTDTASFILAGTGAGRYAALTTTATNGLYIDAQNTTGSINFRTGATPTQHMVIAADGNVGIGTTTPNAKLEITGAAISTPNVISSGAAVDLSLSNVHLLKSVGGNSITLTNPRSGGSYTLIVSDLTQRTYTFAGCTNSYFSPTNGQTFQRTSFSIMVIVDSGNTDCYINWVTGYEP